MGERNRKLGSHGKGMCQTWWEAYGKGQLNLELVSHKAKTCARYVDLYIYLITLFKGSWITNCTNNSIFVPKLALALAYMFDILLLTSQREE